MKRYRTRLREIQAMQFEGTSTGVEEVIAWIAIVAPELTIRPRTEYSGWNDLTAHLELKIRGIDNGCMGGDWIVITESGGQRTPWVVDHRTFHEYYEVSHSPL